VFVIFTGAVQCGELLQDKVPDIFPSAEVQPSMTIFGFNTDVKQGDVVYHVESQARQSDLLLQTMVFVKGQCVGKHAYSFAEKTLQPGFSDQAMHELLKAQHKSLIDALHEGKMDVVLGSAGDVFDIGGSSLALQWTNPAADSHGASIAMNFNVLDSGQAAAGAEVVVFPCPPASNVVIARAVADSSGNATLVVPITEQVAHDSGVIARAMHKGQSATRKFRFKK
jgi:hypothetical protein